MPVVLPPGAGYLGKSRRRISASGLVTWERCPRQWHYRRRIGLNDATVPEMIIGLVVEDALCGLYMERLSADGGVMAGRSSWVDFSREEGGLEPSEANGEVAITDLASVGAWCDLVIPALVAEIQRILRVRWEKVTWKAIGRDIEEVKDYRIENLVKGGIALQIEEVANCIGADGGPYLADYREGGDPFSVPAPCWSEKPVKPAENSGRAAAVGFESEGKVTAWEAWEIARPWVKDPRVEEPQRLFHPDGWGAGEMDLVHRWDGTVRICDIKASAGTSGYSSGLIGQLRFYQWLWGVTRDLDDRPTGRVVEGPLSGLEGWYLSGPFRKMVDLLDDETLESEVERWLNTHEQMTSSGLHPSDLAPADPAPWVNHAPGGNPLPVTDEKAAKAITCERCTGAAYCDAAPELARTKALANLASPDISDSSKLAETLTPTSPCTPISEIPRRLHVKGTLKGHWGPLANHFGEEVRGATVVVGSTNVVVEEMGAQSFGEIPEGEDFALLDVAPGQWRRMTRLYLDEHSTVKPAAEAGDVEFTRLGLIPTRANLSGMVVSRGGMKGVNARGRQWSMETCHLWDGEDVIEVVAFGQSIGRTFQDLRVGDRLRVLAGELGWRDGVPQLRIDSRQTRLEVNSHEKS